MPAEKKRYTVDVQITCAVILQALNILPSTRHFYSDHLTKDRLVTLQSNAASTVGNLLATQFR